MGTEPLNQPTFRHTCDRCGAVREMFGYDYPPGWEQPFGYLKATNPPPLLCAFCTASFKAWVKGEECPPVKA